MITVTVVTLAALLLVSLGSNLILLGMCVVGRLERDLEETRANEQEVRADENYRIGAAAQAELRRFREGQPLTTFMSPPRGEA